MQSVKVIFPVNVMYREIYKKYYNKGYTFTTVVYLILCTTTAPRYPYKRIYINT